MPVLTVAGAPSSVGALSRWSGFESAYGEVRYTQPSVDGGYVTFDLSDLADARVTGAHLRYSVNSAAGLRHVRFANTAVEATDAAILECLAGGESALRLYFSFRAAGGSGGEGSFSAACAWSDIALEITYRSAAGISGEADADGVTLSYFTDKASVLRGEGGAFRLNLAGVAGARSVTLMIGGGEGEAWDSFTCAAQDGALVNIPFTVQGATWQGRFSRAWVRLRIDCGENMLETAWIQTALVLAESYLAPTVACEWRDESGILSNYGCFLQQKSRLICHIDAQADVEADPGAGIVKRALTLGETVYESGNDEFEIGEISLSGSVPYAISVTDSHGLVGTYSGVLSVVPYAPPRLSELSFERYATLIDAAGQPYYEPDDGSRAVRVSLAGEVSAVNGQNAWTLRLSYSDGESEAEATLLSGADGQALLLTDDRSVFPVELSEQRDWQIIVTLSDSFESAQYDLTLPRAGGLFNIEKGGVAVGMRSGGTRALPKFEVAYPAVFYGDMELPGIDSGWQDMSLDNCEAFDADRAVKIRRIGDLVFLRGAVKLLSPLPSGAAGSDVGRARLTTLENGFKPAFPMEFPVVPDRSECYLHLKLDLDGSLALYNRCGYQLGTGTAVPLNLCYLRE